MATSDSEPPAAIFVGQLPSQGPATLSKTLDAVARVNIEKDTFHYLQSNRRFWILSNAILATVCVIVTSVWLYREWSWMEERVQLQRRIYEGMIDAPRGTVAPKSFR